VLTSSSVLNNTVGDAKTRQMEQFTQDQDNSTPLTTYWGAKIAETDVALRAGARGPTVLEGKSSSSGPLHTH
jgi:catalase